MSTPLILNITTLSIVGIALAAPFVKLFDFKNPNKQSNFLLLTFFLAGLTSISVAIRQYCGGIGRPDLDFLFMQIDQLFGMLMFVPMYAYIILDLTQNRTLAKIGAVFSTICGFGYLYFLVKAVGDMEYSINKWGSEYGSMEQGAVFIGMLGGVLIVLFIADLLKYLAKWIRGEEFCRSCLWVLLFTILVLVPLAADQSTFSGWWLLALRLLDLVVAGGLYLVFTSQQFKKDREKHLIE